MLAGVVAAPLVVQLGAVRPRLNRGSERILARPPGRQAPRSQAHHAYLWLEVL